MTFFEKLYFVFFECKSHERNYLIRFWCKSKWLVFCGSITRFVGHRDWMWKSCQDNDELTQEILEVKRNNRSD